GTRALGIARDGVQVAEGASSNRIGADPNAGTVVGDEGNVISGDGSDGVQIGDGSSGDGSSGNVVAGDRIGTDLTGTAALGNSGQGVEIDSGDTDNTIGGAVSGSGNLISANGGGVLITGAKGNLVQGNKIGTDVTGTVALGNASWGVWMDTVAAS